MTPRSSADLSRLVGRLPQPSFPLLGRRPAPLPLPANIVCFQRQEAAELNKPRKGRALHHRFVLICALTTAATVCVDDRHIRVRAGEALLVFPFQFHHYINAERDNIAWLFVTFELSEAGPLAQLRYRPFPLTPVVRGLLADLLESYQSERTEELAVLLLALLLARLRRTKPIGAPQTAAGLDANQPLVLRVNQLAQRSGPPPAVKELARSLGISPSHLRARFRASTGVSIGRHLRRLRLERACGLLRLGPQRVSEIAEQCGFSSIYSFSRAFRTTYGVSPLVYRHRGRPTVRTRRAK